MLTDSEWIIVIKYITLTTLKIIIKPKKNETDEAPIVEAKTINENKAAIFKAIRIKKLEIGLSIIL